MSLYNIVKFLLIKKLRIVYKIENDGGNIKIILILIKLKLRTLKNKIEYQIIISLEAN